MVDADDVLSQAIDGDLNALAELLQRHGPNIRLHIRTKIPERWWSLIGEDDVLQETYAEAFLDVRTFQPQPEASF